jgi:hypothetical protein
MTINCITDAGRAFGKGEVLSSILSGSTSLYRIKGPSGAWSETFCRA